MNNEYWLYGEREQLPTAAGLCSVVTMLLCYGQPGPGPLWRDRGNVRGHRPLSNDTCSAPTRRPAPAPATRM